MPYLRLPGYLSTTCYFRYCIISTLSSQYNILDKIVSILHNIYMNIKEIAKKYKTKVSKVKEILRTFNDNDLDGDIRAVDIRKFVAYQKKEKLAKQSIADLDIDDLEKRIGLPHSLFARKYLENCGFAKDAYLAVYPSASPKSASVAASRLLNDEEIQLYIAMLKDTHYHKVLSEGTMLRRLESIIKFNILDLYNEDMELELSNIPENMKWMIKDIGPGKVTTLCKMKAIELLLKVSGIGVSRVEHTGKDGGPIKFILPDPPDGD